MGHPHSRVIKGAPPADKFRHDERILHPVPRSRFAVTHPHSLLRVRHPPPRPDARGCAPRRSLPPAPAAVLLRRPAPLLRPWLAPSFTPQRSRFSCLYQPPKHKTQIKCAKKRLRYLHRQSIPGPQKRGTWGTQSWLICLDGDLRHPPNRSRSSMRPLPRPV
jgi:hypothetical protein